VDRTRTPEDIPGKVAAAETLLENLRKLEADPLVIRLASEQVEMLKSEKKRSATEATSAS